LDTVEGHGRDSPGRDDEEGKHHTEPHEEASCGKGVESSKQKEIEGRGEGRKEGIVCVSQGN